MAMVILHMEIPHRWAFCSQGNLILCKEAAEWRKPRQSLMGMTGAVPANADPLPLNPPDEYSRPDLSQQWPLTPRILQNTRQYSPQNIVGMKLTRSTIKTKFTRAESFEA
jgi:hypothetical protein